MSPPSRIIPAPCATVAADHLVVVYQDRGLTAEAVHRELQSFVAKVQSHLDQIHQAAAQHNSTIGDKIRPFLQARKQRILARRSLVAAIGLPIQHRNNVPATYAVPEIRRKPRIKMPVATNAAFVPEPVLVEAEYEAILSIIRSMVHVMERSPAAFRLLREEDLRWHFLIQLNGQYEGRATGETFNYKGKTDILIREKDRNVFIAECKFWKGPASLAGAIDQVLDRYLHWRDTKATMLLFNRNKEFSKAVEQIPTTVEAHLCFKRRTGQSGETEWKFVLRNRDDSNREIILTVMAFDVPREP